MISNPLYLLLIPDMPYSPFLESAFSLRSFSMMRPEKHRIARHATLRLLPFVALVAGLAASELSLGYWLNPLSCQSCVQKMLLEVFFPKLKAYLDTHEISLINYLSNGKILAVFWSFGMVTLFFTLRSLVRAFSLKASLGRIMDRSRSFEGSIENPRLASALKKYRVGIWVSYEIRSPMALQSRQIVLPGEMVKRVSQGVSQGELEAVVAHELEHIRCKEGWVRFGLELLALLLLAGADK